MKNVFPPVPRTPGLNPFLDFSTYVPDGEPKVFGSRVWLYGSLDRFGGGYCSKEYRAFSAPVSDLTDWTDHGVSFSTAAVPWSDADLYAPDALYHNGKYYLFFCLSDGSEGVAESDSPAGPLGNARRITLAGESIRGSDPSLLSAGGKRYYTWGQFHLNVAELGDDLCTLKPETLHTDVLTNDDGKEGFHEGSSLKKLGDRYCMIYASEYTEACPNRGGRPTKLDYALAPSPYGPYVRMGTVIDNDGLDPETWNNHGSVCKIADDWFVFYHASSNRSCYSRRARVEKLEVDEKNGVIKQAFPTTNGFVKTLLPESLTSPVNACRFFGGAYVTETEDGRHPAVGLSAGAGFAFTPARFSEGTYALTLRHRFPAGGVLRLTLGKRHVLDLPLPATEDLKEETGSFIADAGLFGVTLTVTGCGDAPGELDALFFKKTE